MSMKGINTARGLYYEPYPKLVHWATRKLHPGLIQCGTNTRRWTSNSPNIQQLNKEDGGVRSAILPHHRGAVIVSLDESAQEVRQLADYCMDPSLLTCFMGLASELRDIHSLVGCRILKTTYRDLKLEAKDPQSEFYSVAAKVRDAAKTTLFGLVYGAMAPKIAEGLGISVEEAQSYIDAIFAQFPGIQKWKAATEAFVEKHGWVAVHGGTVRHLRKQLLSDNSYERSKALRQASNARIQGAGASQLKRIMTDIWNSRLIEDFDYRWYFPVHDETVHSIGRGDVVAAVKILHWMMTKQFLHTVPSASSIGFGRNFGELIEIGETFDVSKIEGALAKCFNDPVLLAA
jgi:DNA polymerase-1